MNITVTRYKFTDKSTIGRMCFAGKNWFTLEDTDRHLTQGMDLADIVKGKVYGDTCIPYGTYEVKSDWSIHFDRELPHIINVPGFDWIRIHPGNKPSDTYGCILLGSVAGPDMIYESRTAFNEFFPLFQDELKLGKVYITIIGTPETI
jgi:hypothetical protein